MPIQAPQWTDYLNCPVCCREFGAPPRSPVSLGCGHTLCRHCLNHLHKKQCPFDQTLIQVDPDELVVNTALLQLAGFSPPPQPYHPPCIQALSERDRCAYDVIIKCMEYLAVCLKYSGNASNNLSGSRLSRPMQRKLVTLLQCAVADEEGRGRAARAARSLGERTVTELILQHQNPQQISAYLWAAVRSRGCQFLGPAMQEEVLKLVLLALEDGSALSRKVLVMFVVQRLKPHFPQASKTSIGHVVQLLYRASCFKVSKRECDSSLMQLKEEFRTYESLRREHDAQIVQIATESGLRIAPDQWSALLYGDTAHKSHMQSIIDKLQTPQSFAQSVQELFVALQRTGDPVQLVLISMHLERLAGIDASPDAKSPSWQQLAEIMSSLREVVLGLFHQLQQQAAGRDNNHNHKQDRNSDPSSSQASPQTVSSTPTQNNFDATRQIAPRTAAAFSNTEEELERMRWITPGNMSNGNYTYSPMPPAAVPMVPMLRPQFPMQNLAVPPPAVAVPQMPLPPQPMFGYMQPPQVRIDIATMPPPPPMPEMMQTDSETENMQARSFLPIPERRLYQRFGADGQPQVYGYQGPVMHLSPYNQEINMDEHGATSPYTQHDMSSDLLPEYGNRQGFTTEQPEAAWTQGNEVYYFDRMRNALPAIPSTSKNVYHGWHNRNMVIQPVSSNIADDQELEEELQALEQRICTEFKSAD